MCRASAFDACLPVDPDRCIEDPVDNVERRPDDAANCDCVAEDERRSDAGAVALEGRGEGCREAGCTMSVANKGGVPL